MTYIFYDTETTGLKNEFDQILQLGAIKTDEELNEIDRIVLRCRLLPHVVPSPRALQVSRTTHSMLIDPGLPSYREFMSAIHARFSDWSPSVFIGFNTVSFDENFLRQGFFQTLHSVYLTNTDGNTRADILKIARAMHLYFPGVITVPRNEDGKENFRLEKLASANGISHKAHDAMGDAEATLALARKMKNEEPEGWNTLLNWRQKRNVSDFLYEREMVSLSDFFARSYSWVVTYCGINPEIDSQIGVFDLAHEPEDYMNLSVNELIDVLNDSPKIIRIVRANAFPVLMPLEMTPGSLLGEKYPADLCSERARTIRGNFDFQERVGEAIQLRYEERSPSPYPEKQIYEGFPRREDERLMQEFHSVGPGERKILVDQIQDSRLKEFALRLVYIESPEFLSQTERTTLEQWHSERLFSDDPNAPWLTVRKALSEIDALIDENQGEERERLEDLRGFIRNIRV